jgi:pimeloyl-ACP methyl ester carboxylesterase
VKRRELVVAGRPGFAWEGGSGHPLVLLHGAWGGAEAHWGRVWDLLTPEFRVVAPEFPGLAYDSPWVPASLDEAAGWLDEVLSATGVGEAWIAGNSFGAAVAAQFAACSPARCTGLVLVDGAPAPELGRITRSLVGHWPVRPILTGLLHRNAYSRRTLGRAFADPERAPGEVRDLLMDEGPRQLDIVSRVLSAGHTRLPFPPVPTLIVWGEEDGLAGSSPRAGRRLAQQLSGAELAVVRDAGHLPQAEQPHEFARAVIGFVERHAHGGEG